MSSIKQRLRSRIRVRWQTRRRLYVPFRITFIETDTAAMSKFFEWWRQNTETATAHPRVFHTSESNQAVRLEAPQFTPAEIWPSGGQNG